MANGFRGKKDMNRVSTDMAKKSDKASPAAKPDQAEDISDQAAGAATSLLVTEIVLRSIGRLTRHSLEKVVARRRYDAEKARAIVEDRSMLHTAAAYGVTKLATRSVPGALLVGGGLLAKTLYDRGTAKRKSRKAAKKQPAPKSED